jgi:DNA-binding response OmpR family regulator
MEHTMSADRSCDTPPTHYRILIVEDDLTIAGNLYSYLEGRGFVPDVAYEGTSAAQRLGSERFDAVVLDIGLPGMDGYGILRDLRTVQLSAVPVLVLTARVDLEDKLAGFSHGADDYLTKPFALPEVEARLRALIQRATGSVAPAAHAFGALRLDRRTRRVTLNEKPLHLTRKSAHILELLLRDPGRVLSRDELETALWGGEPPSSDALRSQVHLLRRALSEAGFDGIETVHGLGWRLVLPDTQAT